MLRIGRFYQLLFSGLKKVQVPVVGIGFYLFLSVFFKLFITGMWIGLKPIKIIFK